MWSYYILILNRIFFCKCITLWFPSLILLVNVNGFMIIYIYWLRVRLKINLHFRVLRRPHDKARGGRIAGLFNRRATQSCGMNRLNKMWSYFWASPKSRWIPTLKRWANSWSNRYSRNISLSLALYIAQDSVFVKLLASFKHTAFLQKILYRKNGAGIL